jgi:outer membrane protein OmpA-like peptidoglycan-associated protein
MKMLLRNIAIGIIGLGLLLVGLIAQAGEGTAGSDFLNLIPGARSAAMAGCYSAAGNDAESLFFNPAGILGLLNPQIGLSHMSWWEGVLYDAVWGVQPMGKLGSIGIAAALLNVLPFNSTEDPDAAFEQAWSLLVSGSYAIRIQRSLAVGGQIKYCMTTLGSDQSMGIALDLGAQYFMANDQLVLAATAKNLGTQTVFLEAGDAMPISLEISAAYQFWPDDPYRLMLTGNIAVPVYSQMTAGFGAEGWLENLVALRLGVKVPQDAGDWLTVGTGVRWRSLHVDYALSPIGLLGMVHRVSLGYDFGSQKRLARPKLNVSLVSKQFVYPSGEAGYAIHFIPKAHIAAGVNKWEILIRNALDQTIRKFHGEKTVPMSIVWDGKDALETRMDTESTYYYTFDVLDRQGYSARVVGEILPISITSLPKLKAMPRDIFAGKLSFQLKDVDNMQEWSVDILSDDGQLLKRYSGMGGIPKDFAWDGKDAKNNLVAVKKGYRFVLRVKDTANNEMKSVAPIIVVDAGTKAWTDSGVPLRDQVPFHFQPTDIKIKRWMFDVIDTESGEVVRSYEGIAPLPETLVWDAKDNKGQNVSTKKEYSYVLRMQDQIGNVWQQAAAIEKTEVKILPGKDAGLKIKVEQILFGFNQAELKPSMFRKIRKVADFVRSGDMQKTLVFIDGHTDEIGSEKYNLELSLKRANMVMRYLVEEEGLPSASMEMKGFGKKLPLIQEESEESQAMNRRVEITLVIK